jgi:16S rRNA G966 N2-methylase RsmD
VTKLAVEERVAVVSGRAERLWESLGPAHGPFDLLFLDPPYADRSGERVLELALGQGVGLAPEALVIFQHARREPPARRHARNIARGSGMEPAGLLEFG